MSAFRCELSHLSNTVAIITRHDRRYRWRGAVHGVRRAASRDLALTTAGAEWRLASGVSFPVKFDGEFGERSEACSGTGRIRYTW
jgi:hypothetical protein